jgi:hypothetical protein
MQAKVLPRVPLRTTKVPTRATTRATIGVKTEVTPWTMISTSGAPIKMMCEVRMTWTTIGMTSGMI